MFIVSEAEAAAIRAIFHERGELSAVVELRGCSRALRTMRRRESACGQSPAGRRRLRCNGCPDTAKGKDLPAKLNARAPRQTNRLGNGTRGFALSWRGGSMKVSPHQFAAPEPH